MQARVERGAAVPAAPARPVPFKAVYRGRPRIAAFARQAETVPFTRSNLIDVISDRCGKYVERRALEPSSLPARGDPLSSLYRCWCDLGAAGACRFSSIDSVPLTRAGSLASCMSSMSATSTGGISLGAIGYDMRIGPQVSPRADPVAIMADSVMRD